MDKRTAALLEKARTLAVATSTRVAKTMWSSAASKKRLSRRLSSLLPAHRTYVEPFAGTAAVFFAKQRAEVEVLNEADTEIADAYRTIQRLTPEQLARLRRMSWTGSEARYKRLYDNAAQDEIAKLHRFLYLAHFSYGKLRGRSFSPPLEGVTAKTLDRLEMCIPRLKGVRIFDGDYERVVRKFDAPDTVYFLDPPYAGYNANVGESSFDEERFFQVLKCLKGKFVLTYGIRGKLPQLLKGTDFHVKRIRTQRSIRTMRGVEGPTVLTQLLVTNFEFDEQNSPGEQRNPTTSQLRRRRQMSSKRPSVRHVRRLLLLRQAHRAADTGAQGLRRAVRGRGRLAVCEGAIREGSHRRQGRRRRVPASRGQAMAAAPALRVAVTESRMKN